MNNFLVRYRIITNRGSGVAPDNMIDVFWDDVAEVLVVKKIDNILDPSPDTMTSGPDLGAHGIDFVIFLGIDPPFTYPKTSQYSFCDGTSLVSFITKSTFPYITRVSTPNHFSCASAVCDLSISPFYHWGRASDIVTADGFIEVFATSSHGPIKYSLDPNFNYATQGQASGLFEDLFAGTYTVTAKDAMGCIAKKTITITVSETSNVRYRLEYKDLNGIPSRLDILERGYTGSVTEVDGGSADPVIISYGGGAEPDKFKAIVPSDLTACLWSPTNFFFQDLFTQDERKYQARFYKNYGSGLEIIWVGHEIASNGSEPYVGDKYPVTITFTDGLADLQSYDFLDRDDAKFTEDIVTLTAIRAILEKTGLEINIQSAVNQFETDMDQAVTDDPLPQCMFNPETFYHNNQTSNCFDALSEIIKPFRARILQRKGKWFIYNIEQAATSMAYREFDAEGTYVTNGTINDVVARLGAAATNRAVFTNQSTVRELLPTYGRFYFEHTLLKWDSLVKSHGFELEDVYADSNGVKQFKNWNINIANNPGTTYGIKKTKALEGDYNLFIKYQLPLANSPDGITLTALPIDIEYETGDVFEFRFTYAAIVALVANSFVSTPWVKVKWMFKLGDNYFTSSGQWTDDVSQKYNDVIVSKFNQAEDFKIEGRFPSSSLHVDTAQVEFIFTGAHNYDFEDITALKPAPTTTKATTTRVKVPNAPLFMNYYELVEGTDAESLPDIVRPDDYATTGKIWVLRHRNVSTMGIVPEYFYLDNVVLLHHPNGAEAPNDVTIERLNNRGIRIDLEKKYLLNDIDLANINNNKRTYKNYFKMLDGTPTQEWERTYRAGKGKLLDLLTNDYVSQYKTPSKKMTGSLLTDTEITPSSVLNEVFDSNTKYMFIGYTLHDKHASIDFDIVELKDTVTDTGSEAISADFNTDFSLDFDS